MLPPGSPSRNSLRSASATHAPPALCDARVASTSAAHAPPTPHPLHAYTHTPPPFATAPSSELHPHHRGCSTPTPEAVAPPRSRSAPLTSATTSQPPCLSSSDGSPLPLVAPSRQPLPLVAVTAPLSSARLRVSGGATHHAAIGVHLRRHLPAPPCAALQGHL